MYTELSVFKFYLWTAKIVLLQFFKSRRRASVSQFSDRRLVEKLTFGDFRAVRSAKAGEETLG